MSAKVKSAEPQAPASMDLGSLGDLSSLMSAPVASNGPLALDVSLIDEDPDQPRTPDNPGFSAESIAEIGATILARGVKSPISVRENLEIPGRFIVNHGARRLRGTKWAKKATIPGFIDNDYNVDDQVIENLQRNELTAREIADYIGRELAKGRKKGDIAKDIGKSASFVSQHVTLLDLPEPLAEAFSSGRVKDVTVLNDLATAFKKSPGEVTDWLEDDTQEVTRGTVKLLREFLDDKIKQGGDGQNDEDGDGGAGGEAGGNAKPPKEPKDPDPDKLKKAIVQVEHDGRLARLILNRRPTESGRAWMKYEDDGAEFEAVLSDAVMVQLIEG